MSFKYLLAKSCKNHKEPDSDATLFGHIRKVVDAVEVIFNNLQTDLVKFCNDDIDAYIWREGLIAVAAFHDIGKANDHFQLALRKPACKQGIRHESLGFVLLNNAFAEFWQRYPSWFKFAVLFAVAGHHLKFPDNRQRPGSSVVFLGDHPDIAKLDEYVCSKLLLKKDSGIRLNLEYSLDLIGGIGSQISQLAREMIAFEFTESQKKFIGALKALLMCSDIPGSTVFKEGVDWKKWLDDKLSSVVSRDEIGQVIQQRLRGADLHPFQKSVGKVSHNTVLIEAGCGSGKTLAAYYWASIYGNGKRVFFCYPTTATSSEGFSNYLAAPEFEAVLKHSRANIDYELLENMPEQSLETKELALMKLQALELWPFPVVVCTTHTVLGIMQNYRTGIYAFPSILKSVFVFDEVHSLPDRLFMNLLRFLQVFQNNCVLLMTATLPPERKRAIISVCEGRGGISEIKGPPEREESLRYRLTRGQVDEVWPKIDQQMETGGKVLWVVNTIARAVNLARSCYESGYPVQLYHSRYRYKDRLKHQRAVIDGFLPGKPAMIAITTQVAEMSLDISADLLLTEYAPVPALIQRLGRLNRFDDKPESCKEGIFLRPESALPYSRKSEEEAFFNGIDNWLNLVADNRDISQKSLLETFFKIHDSDDCLSADFSEWLDRPDRSLSDQHSIVEPGFTIDMVREEDLRTGPPEELAIPMPVPEDADWKNWSAIKRFLIAPVGEIVYDEFWGGTYAASKQMEFEVI